MLGRFTCTIHQLLIRSSCFVENNLLLIQGFQVSVYSLKSVLPTLCIETSSSPLFSPLFLFLIPLSPHSSFHSSSSPPSFLTPLFTPPPQPPLSSPSSSPLFSPLILTPSLSSTLSLPLLLTRVSCKFCDFYLFEPKLCWRAKLYIPTSCMFYQFWIIMSSSPRSLLAPLLIPPPYPLSPHPSSSSPSLLTSLLTPPPHPRLSSPSSSPLFSPLLLTPSLLTPFLTPPPHPGLSSPSSSSLLLTHSLFTHPLLTPPPHPGQLQVL